MATSGQRTTLYTGAVLPGQIIVDMAEEILNIENGFGNDETPFFVLSQKMSKKREVHQSKYDILEDTYNVRQGLVQSTVTAGATAIHLSSSFGNWLGAGSMLYVPRTGERILLTAAPTNGSTLPTVVRNVGGAILALGSTIGHEGNGKALAAGDVVLHINDNFAEGTVSPSAITTNVEESYNYTAIEKTTVQISGTLEATDLYGEPQNDRAYQLKKKGKEHKMKMERNLWFGPRSVRQDGTSGTALRTFAGALQHIQGNILDISGAAYGGVLTARVVDQFCELLFMNGSDTKVVFCGMKMADAFTQILRNIVRVDDKKTSYGVIMKEYISPNGRLLVVPAKKIFDTDTYMQGTAVALDMRYIRYVYLKTRDTKIYNNVQQPDLDGKRDYWLTEYGLEVKGWGMDNSHAADSGVFRSVHGMLTGFSSY